MSARLLVLATFLLLVGFLLKLPHGKTEKPREDARVMIVFGNMDPHFADTLLKLMHTTILLKREELSQITWRKTIVFNKEILDSARKCLLFAIYIFSSARCPQDIFDHCSRSQK